MINRLEEAEDGFDDALSRLLELPEENVTEVEAAVAAILEKVKKDGDAAVLEYTAKFDRIDAASISELEIPRSRQQEALEQIDPLVREALELSHSRVTAYHERQKKALGGGVDWHYHDELGNELGQTVRGMERVGLYAPGGKAAYPSTVLMTAIPARVAGVGEIILTVPTPGGDISNVLLAAACLCGVDRVITIGGAQAVAALAYGTESVPRVDKIVGPGNIYVATAKEMVFGQVGIDMIAGPSEVLIVADESSNPEWLAMDLFAQAEHDEMAQAILVSDSMALLNSVEQAMISSLERMPRSEIIAESLRTRGALIHVESLHAATDLVNRIAPEHLELSVADPDGLLADIRHAGAVFIGSHSAEAVGDYTAGPSHVLPTSGTARFGSPLGVYDFQVRSSIIRCSARGSVALSRDAAILARQEGLHAHAESAEARIKG